MDLPFLINNRDWQELRPKEIDQLGKRTDLDPEQERLLQFFRVIDQRVEWTCSRMVIAWNALVVLWIITLGVIALVVNGVQMSTFMLGLFGK